MSTRLWLLSSVIWVVLCISGSGLGSTPSDSVAVPPIETFMQIGSAGRPQITEDGRMVFFDTSISGVDQVYKLLSSGWPYQMTVFADGIDFFEPSPSGAWIVVGASVGGSEQSDLYLLNERTGAMSALKQGEDIRHGSPLWSPDENYVYFASNEENGKDFFIYRIDIESRNVEKIWHKESWNSTADITRDGTRLLLEHYVSNVNSDLYLVDLVSGEEALLTEHEDDYIFDYGRLDPDGKYVYFVTNMNEDGLIRVARMDVSGGDIEFVNPASPWETEEMDLSPDGRLLAWVENVEGYGSLYVLDLETSKKTEVSELRGIVSRIDISAEGTVVFAFTSPSMPPDIWRYDVDDGNLEQLTYSTFAGIDRSLFVEPELVKYESFDGLTVPAFLYLPPDWDGKRTPFIVHAHGGPENQFRPSFVRHFQYLVLNGYGVLAPNIRGSSGYGREYIKLDDYKKRKDSVRDIYEGAEWLVENGYSRFGKIGIKGASYGGYMTLAALVEYPEVFGAGIDHIGIANFVTFLKNTKAYRRAIREAEYGPLSDEEFLKEISPLTHADRIRVPLLIVHGENDPRVPVGEARQIAEAVRSRGGIAETLIFPDEGHGVAKLSNRLVYYRKMVEFLDKYLKD